MPFTAQRKCVKKTANQTVRERLALRNVANQRAKEGGKEGGTQTQFKLTLQSEPRMMSRAAPGNKGWAGLKRSPANWKLYSPPHRK